MGSEAIEVGKCPVCDREGFPNISSLINHIKLHNEQDPEQDKSVVAEQDNYIRSLF